MYIKKKNTIFTQYILFPSARHYNMAATRLNTVYLFHNPVEIICKMQSNNRNPKNTKILIDHRNTFNAAVFIYVLYIKINYCKFKSIFLIKLFFYFPVYLGILYNNVIIVEYIISAV